MSGSNPSGRTPKMQSPAPTAFSFPPPPPPPQSTSTPAPTRTFRSPTATTNIPTTAPILGGVYKDDIVWIGGPPNVDFSGPYCLTFPTPLCLRNLDATMEIKGYTKRTQGHDIKFKRDDPEFGLNAFAEAALQHMQQCGMDTVFYMEGVDVNGEGGEELFHHHTRFTKATVDAFIAKQIRDGVYDKYQKEALAQSAVWLYNSLDESLKASLRTQLASRPYGPSLWMIIVDEVQSDSLDRCDNIAEKFKAMKLADFKGENVREYAAVADEILTQLQTDRQLPRNHLKTIVDAFCKCTVEDFRIHWMGRRASVQQFIKDSAGKEEPVIKAMPNYIHFSHLLDEGKREYLGLEKQWGTAKQAVPNHAAMISKLTSAVAKIDQKLDQQLKPKGNDDSDKKKDLKCYGCNKPGFTKKTCPDCNKGKKGDDKGKNDGGKWAPPKDGEPHEKMIDGVKMFYCEKCRRGKGRWTKDHGTDKHQVGFLKDKKDETPAGTAKLAEAPIQDIFSGWANFCGGNV